MLNNVPNQINKGARAVVLNHPNAWPAFVFRKRVNRLDDPPGTMGGAQTLGGIGVLDSEDESDVDWDELGHAAALIAEPFAGGGLNDRDDAVDGEGVEMRILVESVAPPGSEAYFEAKKRDVVYVMLGEGVALAFEVVGIEGGANIPPYTRKYVVNKRDDLHYIPAFKAIRDSLS